MLTLLIIFAVILLSGLVFWFYNRKQVNSLSEQIDDKNLVITALKNHVEEVETPTISTQLNNEWRGGKQIERSVNLTPTIEQVKSQKPQKSKNRNSDGQKKSNNQSSKPNNGNQKKSSETKTQQTSKPKKNKNKNTG
jgi:type II secretory pathway pseudopilin PulG